MRTKGTPAAKLRCRGPRTFEEIPPGELRAVDRYLSETLHLKTGTSEHLRTILDYFELKRLTAQVEARLLDIIDKKDGSTAPLFDEMVSN